MNYTLYTGIIVFLFLLVCSFKIIRPIERGLIERFGRYSRFALGGLTFRIPFIERLIRINITEMMVNAEPQTIITKDKLNAQVDAQVYFKVRIDEQSVKNSQYNVYSYKIQIVNLARTTLRNIIGTLTLTEANSDRNRINRELMETLAKETKNWGIDVVRTELKEIDPPRDVQDTMNKVVMAENTKQAAIDYATAKETEADGFRRAKIKEADGLKQYNVLIAEGQAKAIQLVNEAANKYFIGNAKDLKKLEVTQASLQNNSKIIMTEKGISPTLLIGKLETEGGK